MSNMGNNSLKSKIMVNVLSNTIWLAIYPVVTAIIACVVSFFKKNSFAIILSVCSLALSVIILIIVIKHMLIEKKRKEDDRKEEKVVELDKPTIVPHFKASSIEAEFYFANREKMESRISYDMQLTCPSMREYARDLLWSGSEYYGTVLSADSKGDYEIDENPGPQSPHDYIIKFKSEKRLGDPIKFKTITNVGDTAHIMKPYFSYAVVYQIDTLTLRVSAPKGLIKDVKKAVYADRGREIIVGSPEKIKMQNVGNLEVYTATYKNPTLFYNCFIEWKFTKQ